MMSFAAVSTGASVRPLKFSAAPAARKALPEESTLPKTSAPKAEKSGWLTKIAAPLALAAAFLIPTGAQAAQPLVKALVPPSAAGAQFVYSGTWNPLNPDSALHQQHRPVHDKVKEKLLLTLLGTAGAGAAAATACIISDKLSSSRK